MSMRYVCLIKDCINDVCKEVQHAKTNAIDAIAGPIVSPHFYREFYDEPVKFIHQHFALSDLVLPSNQWNRNVVVVLSDVDCDSKSDRIRRHSIETIKQEIHHAQHLQGHGYVMVNLNSGNNTQLAKALFTEQLTSLILAHVPINDKSKASKVWQQNINEHDMSIDTEDTWEWWNNFRTDSNFSQKLRVVIELSEDIPSLDCIRRWLGEPVEGIHIPSNLFTRNRANYPVLSRQIQKVLSMFFSLDISIYLSSNNEDLSLIHYVEYLKNLKQKHTIEDMNKDFADVLEIPLQPLYHNLDCGVYEVFERDPIKYKLYQEAIAQALIDKVPEEKVKTQTVILMVLGAGRGPLVRAALNAAEKTKRKMRVYIIEKNPNAINTLHALVREMWADKDIHIFAKDMRFFQPKEKADILVSELLGSFGDNELSPECLDCALKLLKCDGISIPNKSTSYINPIMSSKLYNETINAGKMRDYHDSNFLVKSEECTYVVYPKNYLNIAPAKPLFEFIHPNRDDPIDNSRSKILDFDVKGNCVLNGFLGYFDTVLYKKIMISIHPETHTNGLQSWFPLFFPLNRPLYLKAGETLSTKFERCVAKDKIWYEWKVLTPTRTNTHNLNGQYSPIFL